MSAINVQKLTDQARAVRQPAHQMREATKSFQRNDVSDLKSDKKYGELETTVSEGLSEFAQAAQQMGIDPIRTVQSAISGR